MAANNAKSEIGSDWLTIVSKSGTREFAAAFTTNAVIEASVLNQTLSGPAAIDAHRHRLHRARGIEGSDRDLLSKGREGED